MAFELPADCDTRIRRFAEYLASKAPPGRLPGRQHIIPSEITDLLPFLAMYDVIREANGNLRFRARLVGTHAVELFGEDPTGKFLDEFVVPERVEQVVKRYGQVVLTKEPAYHAGKLVRGGRDHVRYHRAAFPLARDGEVVDMLVVVRVGIVITGHLFTEGHLPRR